MFRVNNKSTSSGVLIVNFKHFTPFSSAFNVHFEQVNVGWVKTLQVRAFTNHIRRIQVN